MKGKILALAAAFVMIASGCTGQDSNVLKQILNVDVVAGGVEDIKLTAQVPEFARPDKEFRWHITATPSVDINNLNIMVYDKCGGLFTNQSTDAFKESFVETNRTKTYEVLYTMGQTQMDKCTVRMKTTYTSNMSMSQGIVVLKEDEWYQRMQQGRMGEIAVVTYRTTNPLNMEVSFSQEQPMIEGAKVKMYIDYSDRGTGMIRNLMPGEVKIKFPANLAFTGCDDYTLQNGMLVLSKTKTFIDKSTARSTCEFTTAAEQAVDQRTMFIEALYGYEIDSYFDVNILKV